MKPCIYALQDPRTAKIRYVGKAKDVKARFKNHLNDHSSTRKARWVTSLRKIGCVPRVLILEETTDAAWQEAERWWIAFLHSEGVDLTNHTMGGEGLTNPDFEFRAKISAARRRQLADPVLRKRLLDRLRDPARCAKISLALRGKSKSPEHVAKLPQNKKGHRASAGAVEKLRARMMGNQLRLGAPNTPEMKAKISASLTGRPGTMLGRKMSEEARGKIGLAFAGKPKTLEQRQKMSESRKKWWMRKKGAA